MEAGMNSAIDYHQWKEEHKTILETFSDKNVLMLFSGGKDSSLAMDFLLRAKKEFGFDFKAHTAACPVHRYPVKEKERIKSYWDKRGVNIIWHDMIETDEHLENAPNPCVACQNLRKKLLKSNLTNSIEDWSRLFIIINHSLWDIVSYSLEYILSGLFSNSDHQVNSKKNQRFIQTAQRFYPLLTMKEGYTVFRPLIKYNSNSIEKVITQAGIPTLSIPCKFKEFRPKRILESYYQKMGLRFDYDKVFDFAKRSLGLPDIATYTSIDKEEYLIEIF
jgi:tRNA(Ile)-lysidine synthase TilS/MesJ